MRVVWVLVAALLAGVADGQTLARKGWAGSGMTVESWWQGAVFYQIDPFSFQDSKGDGFGDLKGIAARLDYLQGLGVDAVVLSPFQLEAHGSAQPFDAKYGSEEDLTELVGEASRRKIRVIVDLPLNISLSDEETASAARYWLSRGVAGLRLMNPDLLSSPLTAAQIHGRVADLKKICAGYPGDRVLLWDLPGGAAVAGPAHRVRLKQKAREPEEWGTHRASGGDEVQLRVERRLETMTALNGEELRRVLQEEKTVAGGVVEVAATDGADRPRSFDRYGNGRDDAEIAKVLAAALLTGGGAPELYYGQEIGMETTPARTGEAAKAGDPTPMQWGGEHGFTVGDAWIGAGRGAEVWNVAMEDKDRESLLNWYRRLSALRHATAALRTGTMEVLGSANPDVVAWLRRPQRGQTTAAVLVVVNCSGRPVTVSLSAELARARVTVGGGMMKTLAGGMMKTLASTSVSSDAGADAPMAVKSVSLPAYGVVIGELRPPGLEMMPAPVRSRR